MYEQIIYTRKVATSTNAETTQAMAEATRNGLPQQPPPDSPAGWLLLNQYQRDILRLTAQGLTNAQIGEKLFRATKSIRNQKTVISEKLGLADNTWHSVSQYVSEHRAFLRQH